jgi:glycosyltransferase involved in cell wall biosynthesis
MNTHRPFFSIAIPTWEINGKGAEYLDHSINVLANQYFKDFEVVVSDHSLDDSIYDVCKNWSEYLDIGYYRNDYGRGKIAPNLNFAMSMCSGEYIKIIFQDDFLYGEDALIDIKYAIDNSYKEVQWLVTGCCHTRDGENVYDQMVPHYNDRIHAGYNTISCPSVLTVKNDTETMSFNEDLNWLVDCEYYKRCYDKFGLPTVVSHVCTVNRDSEVRTTNMMTEQQKAEEVRKMIEKYG